KVACPGGSRPLRVFLAQWQKVDLRGFFEQVLKVIVVVGFVPVDACPGRKLKVKLFHGSGVASAPWGKHHLYGSAGGGGQQMDLQAKEKPPFAGCVAPIERTLVNMTAVNAD